MRKLKNTKGFWVLYQMCKFSFLFFISKIVGMDRITVLTFVSPVSSFDKHKTFKKTLDVI